MPLYEYECDACGRRFEMIQKFSDAPPEACSLCGKGPVRRLLSSPAIQFKGTGWYITDYAQKGKSSASDSSGSTKESGEKKTESTSSESKTDSAPASTSTTPASKT